MWPVCFPAFALPHRLRRRIRRRGEEEHSRKGERVRKAWLLFLCVVVPSSLTAQSLLDRTPNVNGGWVGVPGTVYFNFMHRFTQSGAPERQVSNSPTFLLGYAPISNLLIAANYATRSD